MLCVHFAPAILEGYLQSDDTIEVKWFSPDIATLRRELGGPLVFA
jgi:hypothetical protein